MDKTVIAKKAILIAAGLGVGFGTGYFVAARNWKKTVLFSMEQTSELEQENINLVAELRSMQNTVEVKIPTEEIDIPGEELPADFLEEAVSTPVSEINVNSDIKQQVQNHLDELRNTEYGGVTIPETITNNVFDAPFETVRDLDNPYVITEAEFMEDDQNDKIVLTYFEEDNQLTDENESLVPDKVGNVGSKALTMFGTGTDDPNMVYVRNEQTSTDFEIVRDARSYTEVVLGITSDRTKNNEPRKMRDTDDE